MWSWSSGCPLGVDAAASSESSAWSWSVIHSSGWVYYVDDNNVAISVHIWLMAEIRRSRTSWGKGSLSRYLPGFSTIPGGWPWDFWTINSISRIYLSLKLTASLHLKIGLLPKRKRESIPTLIDFPGAFAVSSREGKYKCIIVIYKLVVEPSHLKNISQIGNLSQVGVKINNIWVATT